MQDVAQEQSVQVHKPQKNKDTKSMSKINNNRFLNQNIYNTFLQKRYGECLTLINRSPNLDEFKTYIKSLIQKNCYRLDKSLDLLNQCHIMNKLNYSYLKSISKNYFLLGKYKSSLEVAKDAHKINSQDYEIFYILAKISLALGDKDGAIENFKTANGKQPNQQSFIELAKIYMSNNEYFQASDLLKECIQIVPENPQLFQMLGICKSKLGKLDQAFNAYRQALQIDALKYVSLVGTGSIQLERGAIDEALQTFKKAYKTSPNSAVLWNNIGIATFKKNKQVAAYCCFKRALFLQPFRWDVHSNLALLFIKKQKFLAAQVHLQSALKINRDPVLFNLLGVCLSELKDYPNSNKAFSEAIKMNPNYDQAIFNSMICSLNQGDKPKAKSIWIDLQRKCSQQAVRDKLQTVRDRIMQ